MVNVGCADDAGVAVGRDRVALGAAADLAHDQRGERARRRVAGDAQRVGDAFGVEEGARAEELLAGRGRAAVFDQLGERLSRSREQVRRCGAELVGEHAPDLAVIGGRALAA